MLINWSLVMVFHHFIHFAAWVQCGISLTKCHKCVKLSIFCLDYLFKKTWTNNLQGPDTFMILSLTWDKFAALFIIWFSLSNFIIIVHKADKILPSATYFPQFLCHIVSCENISGNKRNFIHYSDSNQKMKPTGTSSTAIYWVKLACSMAEKNPGKTKVARDQLTSTTAT